MSDCGIFGSNGCDNDNDDHGSNNNDRNIGDYDDDNYSHNTGGNNSGKFDLDKCISQIMNKFSQNKAKSDLNAALREAPHQNDQKVIFKWHKNSNSWSNLYSYELREQNKISQTEINEIFKELESLPKHKLNILWIHIIPVIGACSFLIIFAAVFVISSFMMRGQETALSIIVVFGLFMCLTIFTGTILLYKMANDYTWRLQKQRQSDMEGCIDKINKKFESRVISWRVGNFTAQIQLNLKPYQYKGQYNVEPFPAPPMGIMSMLKQTGGIPIKQQMGEISKQSEIGQPVGISKQENHFKKIQIIYVPKGSKGLQYELI